MTAGENPPEEEDDADPVTQSVKEHRETAIAEGMSEDQWMKIQRNLYKLPEERVRPLHEEPVSERGFGTHEK